MKNISSPYILKLYNFWENEASVFVLTELMTGGNLYSNLQRRGKFSENDARAIVLQIIRGVDVLHTAGVCHRNIKPENILCSAEENRVVLSDFGLSKFFGRGELMLSRTGTPGYVAPEIVGGGLCYDKAVDLWSVGVITYFLLCGYPPFQEPNMLDKTMRGQYSFPSPHWDMISDLAKSFIASLLQVSPNLRLTSSQALLHPWIQATEETAQMELDISGFVKNSLKASGVVPLTMSDYRFSKSV
eukprot:TRINITY_DN5628_c0_g1_i2.p1 TRINITY_DN5628_c0_g1~~TRINITY_DN5628_c0_g1_i2.p1  ORF type:complete len:244 (-),score=31.60 TRINITY_DN5628_c0_g1_i2:206-937(-)